MKMVTLEPGEIMVAKHLAAERTRANAKAGIFNQQRSNEPAEDVELTGVAGELACCKACNCWPDLTTEPRAGGFDLRTKDGKTMDVKTSPYLNADLLVTPNKADKGTDRYALVTGAVPNFNVIGYADAKEVFVKDNLADKGYGLSHTLSQEQLHPFND